MSALRSAAGGMAFKHLPEREHLVDIIARPVGNEDPFGRTAYQQHLAFEFAHRFAHRRAAYSGDLGQLLLGNLIARLRCSAEQKTTDLVIGNVGSARHLNGNRKGGERYSEANKATDRTSRCHSKSPFLLLVPPDFPPVSILLDAGKLYTIEACLGSVTNWAWLGSPTDEISEIRFGRWRSFGGRADGISRSCPGYSR